MTNTYDIGDRIRLSATFEVDGTPTDPDSVIVKVLDPSNNEISDTPTKEDTGDYYYDITLDETGIWHYRFEGTGAATAAEEEKFAVRTSHF